MRAIVAHQLDIPVSKVAKESRFVEDLGADSLDILQMILEIEEELGIDIPDEEGEMMQCINDVLLHVGAEKGTFAGF